MDRLRALDPLLVATLVVGGVDRGPDADRGQELEAQVAGRARRELHALLERAPTVAHRRTGGDQLEQVPVDEVAAGDVLVVRPGEVVAVDGVLVDDVAVLDESQLIGESLPVDHVAGDDLLSGAINGAGALTMRATTSARDSEYQRIVELVRVAAGSRAPVVRLADRIAVPFTLFSVALAARLFVVITRTPVSTWPKTDRSAAKATPGQVSFPLPGWGDVPGPLEPTGTRLGVR